MAQESGVRRRWTQKTEKATSELGADSDEVQELLDQLAAAVTSGDGKAAARLWEAPAYVLGDNDVMTIESREDIAKFFGGAKEQYNERGIVDTHANVEVLTWITERLAVATVRWPYLDGDGNEKGEETSTYVLRREQDGKLRLRIALMHGASGE